MSRSAIVTGIGMYVPEKVLTNLEIEQMLKRPGTAEWLVKNVGIEKRHIMADDETTSDLGTHAGREALEKAGISPEELNQQVEEALKKVESVMGKKYGDTKNPLLVSVRSGARQSMPGTPTRPVWWLPRRSACRRTTR